MGHPATGATAAGGRGGGSRRLAGRLCRLDQRRRHHARRDGVDCDVMQRELAREAGGDGVRATFGRVVHGVIEQAVAYRIGADVDEGIDRFESDKFQPA